MDTGRNKQIPRSESQSAGHVVIDSRGRNVWQWSDDQLDSTTIVLKRLDNSELALEPTRKARRPDVAAGESAKSPPSGTGRREKPRGGTSLEIQIEQTLKLKPGGGFDPYNRS